MMNESDLYLPTAGLAISVEHVPVPCVVISCEGSHRAHNEPFARLVGLPPGKTADISHLKSRMQDIVAAFAESSSGETPHIQIEFPTPDGNMKLRAWCKRIDRSDEQIDYLVCFADAGDDVTAHQQTLVYATEVHDLYHEVRDHNHRLEVLNAASDALQRTRDIEDVAQVGLGQLTTEYNCGALIGFLLPDSRECHLFSLSDTSSGVAHLMDDIEPRRVAVMRKAVEDGALRSRRVPNWVRRKLDKHFDRPVMPMRLVSGFSTASGNTSFICVSADSWKSGDEYLRSFIDTLSIALRNAVHYEELKRQSSDTEALLQSARSLSESLQISDILQALCRLICGRILESEAVAAVQLDSRVGRIVAGGMVRHANGQLGNLSDLVETSCSDTGDATTDQQYPHDASALRSQIERDGFCGPDSPNEWKTGLTVHEQKGELVIFTPAHKPLNQSKKRLVRAIAEQARVVLGHALMFAREASRSIETRQRQDQRSVQLLQMAHELKTPVTAIRPLLDILGGNAVEDDRARQKEIVGILDRSVNRLEDVSNRYLSGLQSSEAPERATKLEVTDLWLLLQEAARFQQESFRQNRQTLRLSSAFDDPVLVADPLAVEEILINIFSNCQKYAGPGAVVDVSLTEKGKRALEVTISDTGVGMSAPKLRKIRNSMRLTGESLDSKQTLGLQICARLIALHGGRSWIRSQLGKGTSIGFTLPRG